MVVRYRPMRRQDFSNCVNSIANHPFLAPRYGNYIRCLRPALAEVFGSDSFSAVVFEDVTDSSMKFMGFGMGGFASDDFMSEIKNESFWIGPELSKRICAGKSPFLPDHLLREMNSRDGLNLVVWQTTIHPKDFGRADVGAAAMDAFYDSYRGYFLKEIFAQADCFEQLIGMKNCGGYYFDRTAGRYGAFPTISPSEFADEPRNSGISRALALKDLGSWLGALFAHQLPQFRFTRGEQRLLVCALAGGTDIECSRSLGISLSAVKRTWRSIYERVANRIPELLPTNGSSTIALTRGKGKKNRLLAYLHHHPEELRPISRRAVEQKNRALNFGSNYEQSA